MDNLNFSINPESLNEKGQNILNQFKIIDEAINDIRNSQSALSSWQSANKDKYEAKINNALPKMEEMARAVASYGNVAKITSQAIVNTENIISKAMEQ